MDDIVGFIIVAFLIIGFTYGLVIQIQYNIFIQKKGKTYMHNYRRSLIGNYLASISFSGFLISYVLNILVAIQIIQSNIITSENTSFTCLVFLLILFLAKFIIIPNKIRQGELLSS
ncbi:hypothetical protein [Bacillus suaedae]|uniref:Uncharacterized protein n=1 Tax=Halalkalibacter suaedae TaxID=2822140 RepID=A0A941APH4_9BACI|nr:hypothetical protein [Bacillus suaedae]MBP3951806.1 hypothetical protein [Bacillus suaedae]